MKKLYYLLLVLAMSSCWGPGPKYKNPVTVKSNDVPLYDSYRLHEEMKELNAHVVVLADAGDTLELQDIEIPALTTDTFCVVSVDARRTRFRGSYKTAYVERKYLNGSNALLREAAAGTLNRPLIETPADKPEHLHKR
jgi:hypothetical protein